MTDHEQTDLKLTFVKIIGMWIASLFALDYHTIVSNVLVTLSVGYLVWKWWRDWKKSKKEK